MVACRHRLSEHEFEQVSGVDDGREAWSAAVHGGRKYSEMTELKKRRCAGEILYFSFLKWNFLFLRLLPPWWQKDTAVSVSQAQSQQHMGLLAPGRVGSLQTRDGTHVSCIGRCILKHRATSRSLGFYILTV